MPIPDDERFERYLSQFRPLTAEPLLLQNRGGAIRRRWIFALAAAAALALVLASLVAMHIRAKLTASPSAKNTAGIEQVTNAQPLTSGRANDLLAHAPSFKAALDAVAFQRRRSPLSKGTRSALAALSKEDVKL